MIPLDHPLILTLAGSVGGFILGYFGLRRGLAADKVAAKSEEDKGRVAAVSQIIQGLDGLINSLQEDNKVLREDLKACAVKLETVMAERDELRQEVRRLNEWKI